MTRVDLKGQRPDEATETRGMAEQGRLDEDVPVNVSNRSFLIILVVMIVILGGLAIAVRLA